MRSVRFRIIAADLLLLALGMSVTLGFGTMLMQAVSEQTPDGRVRIPVGFLAILAGGVIAFLLGLARLFVRRWNPALRTIDRAGPHGRVVAEIDAELKHASVPCDKVLLTQHWLLFLGRLSVKLVRLDDIVLLHTRDWQPEHRELVICDRSGCETVFGLDGFEITKLVSELRRARPAVSVDDTPEAYQRWRANPKPLPVSACGRGG